MDKIGIIMAGGIGVRADLGFPKQYCEINGHEIIEYSIDAFEKSNLDDYYVVLDNDEYYRQRIQNKYDVKTILGGNTRNESFSNALKYIHENNISCDKIFVNEAARPMITPKIVNDYLQLLDIYDYVYSAAKITDSLECADGCFANRDDYVLVRSPEGYHFKEIFANFTPNSKTTFPGHALPRTSKSYRYFDYVDNYKLTIKSDIYIIESLLMRKLERHFI